jgi:hypothetical protein
MNGIHDAVRGGIQHVDQSIGYAGHIGTRAVGRKSYPIQLGPTTHLDGSHDSVSISF